MCELLSMDRQPTQSQDTVSAGVCTHLLVLPLHFLKLPFHLRLLLFHLQQLLIFGLEFFLLAGHLEERLHL